VRKEKLRKEKERGKSRYSGAFTVTKLGKSCCSGVRTFLSSPKSFRGCGDPFSKGSRERPPRLFQKGRQRTPALLSQKGPAKQLPVHALPAFSFAEKGAKKKLRKVV
jgi:hypothetical protein